MSALRETSSANAKLGKKFAHFQSEQQGMLSLSSFFRKTTAAENWRADFQESLSPLSFMPLTYAR